MKQFIISTLILICSISLCLAETPKKPKKIEAQVGQNFTLTLEANPTTGYEWQLAKPLDATMLQYVSVEYVADKTDRVGSGGKLNWVLKALRAGETTVSFKYVRPWESDKPVGTEETFLINIS